MLINFRKSVNPLREAVSFLHKDNTTFIKEGTIRYLRDVYEHIIQVNDSIDMQRDILANIMDLYLSGESNKMNQIMKVLTIIATIFIPLTFIAGIYGMNFENMPELKWEFGYYAIWILFFVIIILMLIFFRRKRWL
jgi:magnesium transporter